MAWVISNWLVLSLAQLIPFAPNDSFDSRVEGGAFGPCHLVGKKNNVVQRKIVRK
jgi:hypothetical protein